MMSEVDGLIGHYKEPQQAPAEIGNTAAGPGSKAG